MADDGSMTKEAPVSKAVSTLVLMVVCAVMLVPGLPPSRAADGPGAAAAVGAAPASFTAETFGAKGDGKADDTAAVQAAVDAAHAAGGGTVAFRPGATYLVTQVDVMAGITLDGNGATVRRPDKTPNKFTRTFTTSNRLWVSDADSPPLVVRDLTLDGNRQNQGPYDKYELEHASLLFFMGAEGAAAKRGRLRAVVENCTFKDSPADGAQVFTNVDARFSNCAAVDCFRGGITVTGGHSIVQISNFVGQGQTHRSGLQWEIDGAGFGESFANESTVDGAVIDGDFDLGLAPGSTVLVDNVICRKPLFYVYAPASKVSVSNSSFAVGQQTGFDNRIVHPGDVTFSNCSFTVTEPAGLEEADRNFAALDVFWNTADTAYKGQRLRLIDCRFDVAPGVEKSDTTYAVYTRPDAPTNDNRVIVDGGDIATAYDFGVHVSQGGRATVKGTRIEAATGVLAGASDGYPVDLTLDGVSTTGAVSLHLASPSPESALTIRNTEAAEAQSALATTYGFLNTTPGGRVIRVDSPPEGRVGGLVGDRARLKTPAAGQPYEWVCTSAGLAAAAKWKSVSAVAP